MQTFTLQSHLQAHLDGRGCLAVVCGACTAALPLALLFPCSVLLAVVLPWACTEALAGVTRLVMSPKTELELATDPC